MKVLCNTEWPNVAYTKVINASTSGSEFLTAFLFPCNHAVCSALWRVNIWAEFQSISSRFGFASSSNIKFWFLVRAENRSTREKKPLEAEYGTNKLNTHLWRGQIERASHCWNLCALGTNINGTATTRGSVFGILHQRGSLLTLKSSKCLVFN